MSNISLHFHHNNPPLRQLCAIHNSKPTDLRPSPNSAALCLVQPSPESTSFSNSFPPFTYPSLSSSGFRSLNEPSKMRSLDSVKAIHAHLIKTYEYWNSDSIAKTLISKYLKLDDFGSACMVFFVGFARNYVYWSYFVEEFESFGGDKHGVLQVFSELRSKGVMFDSGVLTVILKLCASVMYSWIGLGIHAELIKRGFDSDVYLKCALMGFYGRCFGSERASQVFDQMAEGEDLLWNEVVLVNLRNDRWERATELFREMQFSFGKATAGTLMKMLQACGNMGAFNEGKQIHAYVLKVSLESNLSICNTLIVMYSRNGKLELARKVFDSMEDHNLSSWNSLISSYSAFGYLNNACDLFHKMKSSGAKPDIVTWNCLLSAHAIHGSHEEVLAILRRMQDEGFRPNSSSIASVLQAVSELGLLTFGKEIHGYVQRNGLDYDVYVGTSLIDMYVKNDCLCTAQAFFDNMDNRNIVAWNSLISGYSSKGHFDGAIRLLNEMEEKGFQPDSVTWNSLLSGYSIWGHKEEALAVIHQMKSSGLTPNVVSWTALISGSSQKGKYRESLEYFIQMQQEDVKPNSATISSLLRACGGLCQLQKGKEIHCISIRNGLINDIYVVTALIDMYSKSGDLNSAHEVFRKIENKTLPCWNCMIMGFATYGQGKEAIALFDEMRGVGIQPDAITFTALLSGCKNSGLVAEGWKYFDSMSTDYKIMPTIEHYSCLADLLGKAGYLDEAWGFIQTMPIKPDATIWGALLGSCRIHKNMEFAEVAAKKLFELEPYNSANYVLMMNLYASSSRWEDVARLRDLMRDCGVRIKQVWSWIQIDQTVHVFSVEGKPHPDEGEIYFELYHLVSEMKKVGYLPDISCVYQNIDDREKEKALMSHTEKLAITYGLIKTKGNIPIRVIKSTRVCPDCHTAAKYMSFVRKREIFLGDGVHFHHFKDGKCCCKDCW